MSSPTRGWSWTSTPAIGDMLWTRDTTPLACVLGSSVATAADAAEMLTQSPLDWLGRPASSPVIPFAILDPIRRLPGNEGHQSNMSIHNDLSCKRLMRRLQSLMSYRNIH